MAKVTRATQALDRAGVAYAVVRYAYDPGAERIGLQAAEALGVDPHRVIKTLMARVDGKPVCVMLSSAAEVSMKMLAAAVGGKSAEMMPPADAERMTGYRVGGISPFGQQRAVPTVIDRHALSHPKVYINAGQRGLQLHLDPADAARVLGAVIADIVDGWGTSSAPT
jgi:Cys-tRNA(Pro)/Cys-tRNA(Cys) deacylase